MTNLPLSLSSLSLIPLLNFLNSRFCFALSDWTSAIWRNQRRQERFSRRWPCSRWAATLVQTFQVLVSVSASLIWPRGLNDLLPYYPRGCAAKLRENERVGVRESQRMVEWDIEVRVRRAVGSVERVVQRVITGKERESA
jgi:hypothetical protein